MGWGMASGWRHFCGSYEFAGVAQMQLAGTKPDPTSTGCNLIRNEHNLCQDDGGIR